MNYDYYHTPHLYWSVTKAFFVYNWIFQPLNQLKISWIVAQEKCWITGRMRQIGYSTHSSSPQSILLSSRRSSKHSNASSQSAMLHWVNDSMETRRGIVGEEIIRILTVVIAVHVIIDIYETTQTTQTTQFVVFIALVVQLVSQRVEPAWENTYNCTGCNARKRRTLSEWLREFVISVRLCSHCWDFSTEDLV